MGDAIVKTSSAPLGLSGGVRIDGMADVFRLAGALARADGFVPRAYVGRPDAIAAVILTGVELGMGPMEAMRSIHVIEGKPTMSAELMLARARRAGVRTRWLRTDDTIATIAVTVPGDTEPQTLTFSMADAQRAGVAGKGNWSKFPAAMLRARAISAAMRAFCPEVLGASVYESTSGEISDGIPAAEVTVTSTAAPVETPPPAADAAPVKLDACHEPASLRAWCERNGPRVIARAGGAERVLAHAESIGVSADDVRTWLGLPADGAEAAQ